MRDFILIYSDGACSGNPGPGGYASVVLTAADEVIELGGGSAQTTNNRMELMGVISALRFLENTPGAVKVFTDSTYVIRLITQWVFAWKRRGWKTAEGQAVQNQDLVEELDALVRQRKTIGNIEWNYVRGHRGVPGNERCDEISVCFSKGQSVSLYRGPLSRYSLPIDSLPEFEALPEMKPIGEKKQAHSYLSVIGGEVIRHKDWSSCERRVKGRSGAKFKKSMSADDEKEILKSWGFDSMRIKNDGE